MTRFSEFYNKQKNVIKSSIAKRLESGIPITEERDAFYKGELFKKYDIVESEGKQYTVLEQGSNYYHVVDTEGNLSRKFAKQLTKISECITPINDNTFHGYKLISEDAIKYLNENYSADGDDLGLLKQLKQMDENMDSYKSRDKLTIAKIIADAVGVPYDVVSNPDNLVAAALRKAKKDPKLLRNKEIISNMLQIAREVGIKITDETFEVKESEEVTEALTYKQVHTSWSVEPKSKNEFNKRFKKEEEAEARAHAEKTGGKLRKIDQRGHVIRANAVHESEEQQLDEISDTKKTEYIHAARKSIGKLDSAGNNEKRDKRSVIANRVYSTISKDVKKKVFNDMRESEELEESGLSRKTIDSYLEKSKESKPATIHKAIKRFAGQERAQDRVHKDELNNISDRLNKQRNESLTLKELRNKLSENTTQKIVKDKELPDADVEAKADELPHGHSLNPSNETHRKQLIHKIRGDV